MLNFQPFPDRERELLHEKKCLTDETIARIGIAYGVLDGKGRICIPHDWQDNTVTAWKLRIALSEKIEDKKKKWMFDPAKRCDVFGRRFWTADQPTQVWLCEGELDCVLLLQEGFHALTMTTGAATSIEPCLTHIPQNAEFVLAFDNDQAGWTATEKAVRLLCDKRPDLTLRMVHWPSGLKKGADITDFVCICRNEQNNIHDRLTKIVGDVPEEIHRKVRGTQTPTEFRDLSALPPASLDGVLEHTRRLGFVHDYIVEVVLATYISKEITKVNPLWLLLVGVPSSNKTELVSLLRYAPDTLALDVMTSNPFISGIKESEKPQDLLPDLDGKCFTVKDYTSFFGRSEETVKKLLSDLVSIYDGEFAKHSGLRGTVRYRATFSHIGCVTPQGLQMRQQYMNMVGPRFLTIRVPELTDTERERCFDIAWADDLSIRKIEAAKEVISLVTSICEHVRRHGVCLPHEGPEIVKELNTIAQFMARARGIVDTTPASFTDENGEKVTYRDVTGVQIEEPFRALHQLKTLGRALAVLRGKECVTAEEVRTVRTIALSSMSVQRAEVLRRFRETNHLTGKQVAEGIATVSTKTVKRYLDELFHLGILRREKESSDEDNAAWVYSCEPRFESIIRDNNLLL